MLESDFVPCAGVDDVNRLGSADRTLWQLDRDPINCGARKSVKFIAESIRS